MISRMKPLPPLPLIPLLVASATVLLFALTGCATNPITNPPIVVSSGGVASDAAIGAGGTYSSGTSRPVSRTTNPPPTTGTARTYPTQPAQPKATVPPYTPPATRIPPTAAPRPELARVPPPAPIPPRPTMRVPTTPPTSPTPPRGTPPQVKPRPPAAAPAKLPTIDPPRQVVGTLPQGVPNPGETLTIEVPPARTAPAAPRPVASGPAGIPLPDLTDDADPADPFTGAGRFEVPPPRVVDAPTPTPAPLPNTVATAPMPIPPSAGPTSLPPLDLGLPPASLPSDGDIIPAPPRPGSIARSDIPAPTPAPVPAPLSIPVPAPAPAPEVATPAPASAPAPAAPAVVARPLPGSSTLGSTDDALSLTEELLARNAVAGLVGLGGTSLKGAVASSDAAGGGAKTFMVGETPVILHSVAGGWVGPRGERYDDVPSQAKIESVYGP